MLSHCMMSLRTRMKLFSSWNCKYGRLAQHCKYHWNSMFFFSELTCIGLQGGSVCSNITSRCQGWRFRYHPHTCFSNSNCFFFPLFGSLVSSQTYSQAGILCTVFPLVSAASVIGWKMHEWLVELLFLKCMVALILIMGFV